MPHAFVACCLAATASVSGRRAGTFPHALGAQYPHLGPQLPSAQALVRPHIARDAATLQRSGRELATFQQTGRAWRNRWLAPGTVAATAGGRGRIAGAHVLRASSAEETPTGEVAAEPVRRAGLTALAVGALFGGNAALQAADERYNVFGTVLAPAPYKETLRTELVPGRIWGFEQVIALFSVSTNIRMTVVRLKDGKLWVSAPISPTRQCLRMLDELGDVAHLVLPSTALEHKASLGEFARIYPSADVWITPAQSSFPIGQPDKARIIGEGPPPPWADELEYKVFAVSPPVTDNFAEAAFFHKESKTLLVTDCVLKIPAEPPTILESYGYDGTPGPISLEQWRYKALAQSFVSARGQDEVDFEAFSRAPGIVNPLLRFLVYRRCQTQAAAWVEDVASWPFERVVPCHLQAPFNLRPPEFLEAFGFLFGKKSSWEPGGDEQLALLRFVREQVGGPAF